MKTFKNLISVIKSINQIKFFYITLLLMVISTIVETASLGAIIPLLNVIVDENVIDKFYYIKDYVLLFSPINFFSIQTSEHLNFIAGSIVIVLIIFIIKFIYLVIFEWYKNKFVYNVELALSNKLFHNYLFLPFSFFVKKNTSEFHRNIQNEVGYTTSSVMFMIMLISECMVASGIIILMFSIEFFGTLASGFFVLISGLLFYQFTNKYNLKFGQIIHTVQKDKIKHLIHGLEGIKDIKIFNKQNFFFKPFAQTTELLTDAKKNQSIIVALPRLFLELLLVIGVSILVIILLIKNTSITTSLPVLGFFAAAAIRLMPSAYRILNSMQRIKFASPIIENMKNQMKIIKENKKEGNNLKKLNFENKLKITNLNFKYDTENFVFKNLNLEISKGDAIGILGESGSGKSTFVNLLSGLFEPSSGNIFCDNSDIFTNITSWRKNLGYVPQTVFLIDDTLKNNIAFGINEEDIDQKKLQKAIERAELSQFVRKLKDGIYTYVGEKGARISGGQLQRVGIARALYSNPSIIIFDESTSSLDPNTEADLLNNIYNIKEKETIIVISHKYKILERCKKIYEIKNFNLEAKK